MYKPINRMSFTSLFGCGGENGVVYLSHHGKAELRGQQSSDDGDEAAVRREVEKIKRASCA
jgi:hypothetical protein